MGQFLPKWEVLAAMAVPEWAIQLLVWDPFSTSLT